MKLIELHNKRIAENNVVIDRLSSGKIRSYDVLPDGSQKDTTAEMIEQFKGYNEILRQANEYLEKHGLD